YSIANMYYTTCHLGDEVGGRKGKVGTEDKEIHFKVKMMTSQETQDSYSQTQEATNSLRFILESQRNGDNSTPEKLGIKEEDGIEVYHKQIGDHSTV
uniref:Ubiquitin-like domain-containing protein n=1 Tax=Sarcophilus harrisii TaxID=9305 RepID=A0A7N4PVI4_SARHA